MRRPTRLLAATFAAASLMIVAACSQQAAPGTSSAPATAGGGGDAKYAIVLKVLSSEFWQKMEAGVKEKADELGVTVEVVAANSEDDVEGQVALAENLLDQGYAGIGVAPLTADNLVNVVASATEAGIPVISIDEQINPDALTAAGGAVIGLVTTDNAAVGGKGAGFIVEQLGDGGGQVAIIEGKAGTASGEARKQGATETFEAAASVELVDSQPADWDRTKAYDLATNYIAKYPDLKAIYCANDTMAMGAQQAVQESGADVLVVGTDGNADAVESVESGGLAATVAQDSAAIGATSLEMLVSYVESGETFDASVTPEQVFIDSILINA
ncbi:MAG: D-allose transporter substrate-binding protein [Propioniciclava sp.]